MTYIPAPGRYDAMRYNRCGRSGLKLPAISLGLWHNFGHDRPLETQRAIVRRAFDLGITHFDLANNYGPPYGSAEENFGRLLASRLAAVPRRAGDLDQGRLRHVARARTASGARASTCWRAWTRAWRGWASTTSTSSTRTGSTRTRRSRRRWARSTPRCAQGKALYVGISSYSAEQTAGGGRDPARARHAAADPSTLVLDAQPLGRRADCSTRWRTRASGASSSRRWRRDCSPTAT